MIVGDSSSEDDADTITHHQLFSKEKEWESEGNIDMTNAEVEIQHELFGFFDFTKFRQVLLNFFQEFFSVAILSLNAAKPFCQECLLQVVAAFAP